MDLRISNVSKAFDTGRAVIEVLRGISFEMADGQAIAITGPSGSGKSTLLHLIGTLDRPSAGEILIGGQDPFELSEPDLAEFRNRRIGFVFQDHHLLPQYNVLENALIPTMASRRRPAAGDRADGRSRALGLLQRVGLDHRLDHRPAELSGGERQRVAIARALINEPDLLLCDEPTGNLDQKTAASVAELIRQLHEDAHNLLIVVTHSLELAARFERRFELTEGRCSAV